MNLDKYRGLFLEESREHVTALARELAAAPPISTAAVDSLFRHAHSIKGMSASMGVEPVRDLAHAMEDRLGLARKGELALDPGELLRLLGAADYLADQLEAWARGGEVPPAAAAVLRLKPGAAPAPAELELLPEADLDVEPEPLAPEPVPAATPPGERATVRVATAFIDALLERVTELALAQGTLRTALEAPLPDPARRGLEQLRRSVDRLREDTMAIRLMPFSVLVPDLARASRDASGATGKPADFSVAGAEVAFDRAVVEALADPLVHLIRNAIDHGLESPAARALAHKPARGSVKLRVRREADSVYISVRDDGRGMDPEKLVERALAEGRMSPAEVPRMTDADKLLLATLPGLSTAATVTKLSGRGVGLDLVRARIEGLGGKIGIEAESGKFTEVTLRAPLTLALQRLFLVRQGALRFALPVARIAGLFQLKPHEIRRTSSGWLAEIDDGESQPLLPLAEVLGEPFEPPERVLAGVLLEARGRRMVLGVDEALAEAELVVRPLGRPLQRLAIYSAAALLAEGRMALVLDADGILAR